MQPEAKAMAPELENLWDLEMEKAFDALTILQRKVLAQWIRQDCRNMAGAYKKVVPDLAVDSYKSGAALMMKSKAVKGVMDRMKDVALEDFFEARHTLVDALGANKNVYGRGPDGMPMLVETSPDYPVRVRAAEVLSKLHGNNAPEKHQIDATIKSVVIEVQLPALKEE